MKKKKVETFKINAALELNCCDRMIVQPSKLRNIQKNFFDSELRRLERCNLYAILKRPRLEILSKEIEKINGKPGIRYRIKKEGNSVEGCFDLTNLAQNFNIELSLTPYPTILVTKDGSSDGLELSLDIHSMDIEGNCRELLQFEILYIGKALGRKGARNSIQRLASHSKFQEVLEDINDNNPGEQAFVMLFDFKHPKVMLISNPLAIESSEREKERKRMETLYETSIPREEYISMAEAVLIDYFKPRYNSTYTDCGEDVSSFKIFKYLLKNNIKSIFCIFDMLKSCEVSTQHINQSSSRHEFERKIFSADDSFFRCFKK